jgi:translation initiation factor 3 subunit M
MPASSTVVNTTGTAGEMRLVHLLGDHEATSPFVISCEEHIANNDAPSLLTTIFQHPPAIHILLDCTAATSRPSSVMARMYGMDQDEAVGAVTLLGAMLDDLQLEREEGIEGVKMSEEILKLMVTAVESYQPPKKSSNDDVQEKALMDKKLHMLCALYNIRSYTPQKLWILSRIVTLAVSSSTYSDMILSLLPGRNATLGDLLSSRHLETSTGLIGGGGGSSETEDDDVTVADKRALYGAIASAVQKVQAFCDENKDGTLEKEGLQARSLRQKFLLKFLGTYGDGDVVDKAGIEAAKEAAIGAIQDPINLFHDQRGIMSLSPIAALEKNKDTKPLYELLQIFQEKKLQDLQQFQKDDKNNTLSTYNISPDSSIRHMRLLSLCSLASEHEEIPYDAIASTLDLDSTSSADVETWVIAAVSSGLLSAKMDQLQRVVMVERCVVRKFGMEQWKVLKERLDVWKKNVRGVLEGLKETNGVGGSQ